MPLCLCLPADTVVSYWACPSQPDIHSSHSISQQGKLRKKDQAWFMLDLYIYMFIGTTIWNMPHQYTQIQLSGTFMMNWDLQVWLDTYIQIQMFISTTIWNMPNQYTQIQQEHTKRRKNCTRNSNIHMTIHMNYLIHEQYLTNSFGVSWGQLYTHLCTRTSDVLKHTCCSYTKRVDNMLSTSEREK